MKRYNIVLVDNDEMNYKSMMQSLDNEAYEIRFVKDLESYDKIVFLNNINMLVIGVSFFESSSIIIPKIKSLTKHIPILFIISKNDESKIISALESGADGFLFHPLTPKLVSARIKSFVEKYEVFYKKYEEKLQNIRGNLDIVLPHEFRTSISGIQGLTKSISQISYDKSYLTKVEIQEIYEMSNLILNSSSYLSKITENIILYSKLQLMKHNGETENDKISELNPREVIEDIIHSIVFNTERENDIIKIIEDSTIRISQYHFNKIIYELLDNALKFSSTGSKIKVKGIISDDKYTIIISDKGRGMSEDQINQIDAFKQFDRKLHEQQGNGLGLIIAKELCELNEGRFWVESLKEVGTKIKIEFNVNLINDIE